MGVDVTDSGLAAVWFAIVVILGWRFQPGPVRVPSPEASSPADPVVAPGRDSSVGWRLALATVLVATVLIDPRLTVGVAIFGFLRPVMKKRRDTHAHQAAVIGDLPEVTDFLLVAVQAGLTVQGAIGAAATWLPGPVPAAFARMVTRVELGAPLADELAGLPDDLGEAVRPLVRVLTASVRYGTPTVAALARVADAVRVDRRRHAEASARRVPVKLLFPLVTCILPAFALLTVVPVLAGSLLSLDLQ